MTFDIACRPEDVSDAELAAELIRTGKHADALKIHSRLVAQGTPSNKLLQDAAATVVAIVVDDRLPDLPEAEEQALLRALILQPSGDIEPPALHFQIISTYWGRGDRVLERMAMILRQALERLWTEGCRERSFLLMVLLLRNHLRQMIDNAALRQWHQSLLPHFTPAEMTLPYNWMFDRKGFRDNVADVRALVRELSGTELTRRFKPWQIVQLHWITGGKDIDPLLPQMVLTEPADRSLALRAAALGLGPAPPGWEVQAEQWAALHVPPAQAFSKVSKTRALARLESRPVQALQAALQYAARKAPMLRLRSRPRIAVCVSGQLRGWQRALPGWRSGLLQGADCYFFVHTWEDIGRSGAEHFRAHLPFDGVAFCASWREQGRQVGMDELAARYPSLFARLRDSGKVTRAEIAETYGTDHVVVEDDKAPAFAGWSNSKKMHYKLAAAQNLATEGGDDFDLILRIRPDKETGLAAFAWRDLIAAAGEPAIFADLAFGFHYGNPLIGDQVAIGLPKAMTVYAETLQTIVRLQSENFDRSGDGFEGHKSLAFTLWHAGIAVRRLPVKMGRLLEAATMGLQEIADCLSQDASGRQDAIDLILLEAIRRDLTGRSSP
ncbi:hypothetical protein NOJ28_10195 [Neorhizobium galegae]|uniref:hypothetical protein n=1 Tax=Neorhizobium galegae TaxID=399 RepID=UPI0006228412|nr:hypothetical protein [Neorhizobium galegae]MCQ1765903.1 hypothetical protein [Neorhizobium galegae]MCQ1844817.1 hypothetical protein [Neorhizobium galegae]CDZ39573.1 Hypothetical protein NGAL_HAMBI1146_34500 [Neorhizobium galegae bv. officinalis]